MTTPRLITLFTDAGYCEITKRASYAAWAKTDGQTLRRSGIQKGDVPGPDVAELRALVNGVFLVLEAMKPPAGARIIAQTDCAGAIAAFMGTGYRKGQAKRKVAHAVEAMAALLTKSGVVVEYRHVSGHQGHVTPRNSVNTWCDHECRRWLKEARTAAGYQKPSKRKAKEKAA